MTSLLAPGDINTAWADTGEDGATLVSGGADQLEQALIQSASLKIVLRNLNVHPMYVKVYWCLAKRDMASTIDTTTEAVILQQMYDDLAEQMLNTDETTMELSSPGAINLKITSRTVTPWMCPNMLRAWKIKGGRGGWVQPGQTIEIKYNRKKSRYVRNMDIDTTQGKVCIRGLTVIPLLKVHMAVGRDTGAGTIGEHMAMDGYAHCQVFKRITFKNIIERARPLIAYTEGKLLTFTTGGEGPTDDDMKIDDYT